MSNLEHRSRGAFWLCVLLASLLALTSFRDASAQTAPRRFDIVIPAPDGERIGMTVYAPGLAEGKSAPLILHGHGFGLTRARNFANPDLLESFLHSDATAEAARRAWFSGYYVITFDQRGFGESSGNVTLMDPDIDGRNISAIVDWAEANLPNLAYRDGNLVLGALGLSYGGGFQLIGASVDFRFDAIVPTAAWHDLANETFPEGVPKSIWLNLLSPIGLVTSELRLEPFIYDVFLEAQFGAVSDESLNELRAHSLKSFCDGTRADGQGAPNVDAFFVQGADDVLFELNAARRNYECLKNAGNDARLLIVDGGHLIPVLQEVGTQLAFSMPKTVTCGSVRRELAQMMLDFLNEKLRGFVEDQPVPELCLAQGEDQGIVPEQFPVGGIAMTLPPNLIRQGPVGQVDNLLRDPPLTSLLGVIDELTNDLPPALSALLDIVSNPTGAAFALDDVARVLPGGLINDVTARGLFVPLMSVSDAGVIAGTPLGHFNLQGPQDGFVYMGLGLKPADGGRVQLINDQIRPVRVSAAERVELAGASRRVEAGDTVGLMLYGFHPYYLNRSLLQLSLAPITVSGSVELPYAEDQTGSPDAGRRP